MNRGEKDKGLQIRQSFIDSNANFRFKPFTTRITPEYKSTSADLEWLLELPINDDDDDNSDSDSSGDEVAVDKDGLPIAATGDAPAKASGIRNVGLQAAFTKQAGLAALALCFHDRVLIVTEILKPRNNYNSTRVSSEFRDAFQEQLLEGEFYFTAFGAHEVALTVFKDTDLRLSRLFNLLDYPKPDSHPSHLATVKEAFGSETRVFEERILEAFIKREFKSGRGREGIDHVSDLAKEAWLAFTVGKQLRAKSVLLEITPIDLMSFNDRPEVLDEQVRFMSTLIMSAIAEPDKHYVKFRSVDFKDGHASVNQSAYNSRIRRGSRQSVKARMADNTRFKGRVGDIDGKNATLRMPQMQGVHDPKFVEVTLHGKADPTQADARQSADILKILQNRKKIDRDPWYRTLFPMRRPEPKSKSKKEGSSVQDEAQALATVLDAPCAARVMDSDANESAPLLQDSLDSKAFEMVASMHSDEGILKHFEVEEPEPKPSFQDSYWKGWGDDSQGSNWDAEPELHVGTTGEVTTMKVKAITKSHIPVRFKSSQLNDSQLHAVKDMLNFDEKISIIKGPPGTGKTTVIAAVLSSLLADSDSSHYGYIITQSNVGAKNIAEKLVKTGLRDWVLLVSSEFMHEWHNHLYTIIPEENIFIPEGKKKAPHRRFTICTLSMLSNSQVVNRSRHNPMDILLVDEASQIPMPSYNIIIQQYTASLKKIAFIGDNRQLPPYHSDKSKDFNSVFENLPLLSAESITLLNKQYRMPPQIGNFISQHVYEGALCSWESHPVQNKISCQFIDVSESREAFDSLSSGTKNEAEAYVSVKIASMLSLLGLSFKIITPYDAQKDLIELTLKQAEVPWENTVYTVDSFQGNEDDYIIISSVRTLVPGFMRDLRRSNVMLTRAKKGMYICTNISFLNSPPAQHTLLSKMAKTWAELDDGIISSDSLSNSLIF